MKKIVILIVLLFPSNVYAVERQSVTLKKCIDGDTAIFRINKKNVKVRFLAIDTPEISKNIQAYGQEAKDFTCNKLSNAKNIELEYEKNKYDKYGRTLAWVFYDNKLLQKELVRNGLAKVTYLYDDYKYTNKLKTVEKYAINNSKGIYSYDRKSIYESKYTLKERIKNKFNKYKKKIYADINNLFNEILEEIL